MSKPIDKNHAQSKNPRSDELVLDSTIPYQINRLCHQMNKLLDQELRTHGLSISSWRVMAVLDYNSSVSVTDLADYAMIQQSTLSRQLQRMESDGYLKNRPSRSDGRARQIVLTSKGRKKYEAVRAMTMRHVTRITNGFDSEEQAKLLAVVQQMLANVGTPTSEIKSE